MFPEVARAPAPDPSQAGHSLPGCASWQYRPAGARLRVLRVNSGHAPLAMARRSSKNEHGPASPAAAAALWQALAPPPFTTRLPHRRSLHPRLPGTALLVVVLLIAHVGKELQRVYAVFDPPELRLQDVHLPVVLVGGAPLLLPGRNLV